METASSGDKEDGQNNFGVDTRKTYESILIRKQARIAKEAAFERRARALTKHFLRAHEEKESHKLDNLHEVSQRSYEHSMEKVRDKFSSEAMKREMGREENRQIRKLMQERTRQQELEEQKREEKKAEREYFMQARIIHSQLQCEERQRRIEEVQLKRAEEIKDRTRNKVEKEKDDTQEKDEKVKVEVQLSSAAKYDTEIEKVTERRRMLNIQHNKERHEKLSARAEKEERALQQRQKRVETMQQSIRTAEEERHRKVQERKQEDEEELFRRVEQMNLKVGGHLQDTPRMEPRACSSRLQSIATVASKIETTAKEVDMESPKPQDRKVTRLVAPSFDSKELIESNASAHKEYVLRAKELDDIAQSMNVNKKYAKLAEGAAELPDDYREARLKAVHQTHMGQKTTPASKKERSEAAGTTASTPSRQTSEDSPRSPRPKPRLLRCGLCMREYPPDRLVGSALRKTVEKMRNQTANMPNNKAATTSPVRQYERGTTKIRAVSPEDGERASILEAMAAKQPSPVRRRSLYDYEVKLCVNCDIFMRITAA